MSTETAKDSEQTVEAVLRRASEAASRGDIRAAVDSLCSDIPRLFPADASAYNLAAEQLARLDRFDEADKLLQLGMDACPAEPWVFRSYARIALYRQDFPAALTRFMDVCTRFPSFAVGRADLVTSLISAGRFEDAEATAAAAVRAFPDEVWVLLAFASAAEARGDTEAASARWRAVLEKWPDQQLAIDGLERAKAILDVAADSADPDVVSTADSGSGPVRPEQATTTNAALRPEPIKPGAPPQSRQSGGLLSWFGLRRN
jgi:tetratricopeptide (TPR) repeat protein